MGFTKLDDGLIFSSILSEDDAVFKVWVLILSRTERDGIARVSPAFLASVTRKTDADVERCIRVLEEPDSRSRSVNEDGRRIRRVDGGYLVLNYSKYRERADREDAREYERERKRKQRTPVLVPVLSRTDAGPSASASLRESVGGGAGGRIEAPANPLVKGRRPELERECLALVRRLSELTGENAEDVIARASNYKGATTTKLNPATMSDDRLLNTLRDLRADVAEEEAKVKRGA